MSYINRVDDYLLQGWPDILCLPPGVKSPPPKGFTGRDGATPYSDQHKLWNAQHPDGNVALRLPETHVGIDVDAYADKPGGSTLQAAIQRWGALPTTSKSGSREDVSGIYLYQVPEGVELVDRITIDGRSGIELVQHHHRYMVVWPSIHPEGRPYRWWPSGIPNADEIPDLPDAWVEGLRRRLPVAPLPAYRPSPGTPDGPVARAVSKALWELRNGSRHEAARSAVYRLRMLAGEGCAGVDAALAEVEAEFLAACADEPGRDARGEWDRLSQGVTRLSHLGD